jgi:hypothetical protein
MAIGEKRNKIYSVDVEKQTEYEALICKLAENSSRAKIYFRYL